MYDGPPKVPKGFYMQQARGKETRQRLKDAAIRVVSEGGHETASTDAPTIDAALIPTLGAQ